ncbi:hypothetical protein FV222_00230 [Methylobacterium sp. WL103]|uniref:hypothetical protein n=1 Tax=Methylobacterium sp. WL103 TaxID=2603891 RepID=UPI0011C9470F|nr:hypothetical protein [Methylobacterium sp. WL103]TXN08933.1 hypothetical protein FV222_00230 [Methylobacterium sp. WL103]
MTGANEVKVDPLTLVCELATSVARTIIEDWLPNDLWHKTPEIQHLAAARKLLMINGRHVPMVIDEALDRAEYLREKLLKD